MFQNLNIYIPYVYKIIHLPSNRTYIGSRTSKLLKGIHPVNDLGINYFSSSRHPLLNKKLQKSKPEDYRYEVIAQFDTKEQTLMFEKFLHKIYNVENNPSYLNLRNANNDGNFLTDEVQSIALKKSHETKSIIREDGTRIYDDIIKKVNEAKYNNIDENGLNGFERAAQKISKALNTIQENGKTLAQNINQTKAKIMKETILSNGLSISQNGSLKAAETMRNDIDENGLNMLQRKKQKGDETLRNDIDENGLNGLERAARKGTKTRIENGNHYQNSNNPNSRHFQVYNSEDELILDLHGTATEWCRNHNVNPGLFSNAVKNNKLLYNTTRTATRAKNNNLEFLINCKVIEIKE